jgi:hypothetical protein
MSTTEESWYGKLKNIGLFRPGALKHILSGMKIALCLDKSGKIISAYPVYQSSEEGIFWHR